MLPLLQVRGEPLQLGGAQWDPTPPREQNLAQPTLRERRVWGGWGASVPPLPAGAPYLAPLPGNRRWHRRPAQRAASDLLQPERCRRQLEGRPEIPAVKEPVSDGAERQ
ncbi:hypothetical protein AAFF_G00241460 [Aldrovandia affinis]|uniref:Uncharacterized protein n=1 Tax=Aldrovandia affinis TaxID=143900 RepID=A0AAD7WU61_9TELE|nr:hypothetical protein AAFF_G00241460 [Aldrovandia affinis]